MKLLLATHNEHKRGEFERLLAVGGQADGERRWVVERLPDDVTLPPEDGATFAENALGKARAAAAATGRVAFADDSGIAAAALDGGPGVRSARYAGEHAGDEQNLAKLIREVPAGSALEYVCAIAYVDPRTSLEKLFEGRCTGTMADAPRGSGGFGYDPVFVPDERPPRAADGAESEPGGAESEPGGAGDRARGAPRATMAELAPADKDAISHRGRALRALLAWLEGPTAG